MFCPTVCVLHSYADHCWPTREGAIEKKFHQYQDLASSCARSHPTNIITLEVLLEGLPQYSQVSAAVKLLDVEATDGLNFEWDIRHVTVLSYIWHLYKTSVTEFCMACHFITEICHQGSAGIPKLWLQWTSRWCPERDSGSFLIHCHCQSPIF